MNVGSKLRLIIMEGILSFLGKYKVSGDLSKNSSCSPAVEQTPCKQNDTGLNLTGSWKSEQSLQRVLALNYTCSNFNRTYSDVMWLGAGTETES